MRPPTDIPGLMRFITAVTLLTTTLVLLPFSYEPGLDGKYVALAAGVLLLAAMEAVAAWRRDAGRPWSLMALLLALLMGVYLIAAAVSNHPANSFNAVRRLLLPALLFFFAANAYKRPADVWRLMVWVCAGVALSSVYAMFQKAGLDPFPWAMRDVDEYRGLPATFGNPNYAGHVLVIAIVMGAGLVIRRGTRACAIFLPPMILHLWFTQMRAAVVALAVAAALAMVAWVVGRLVRNPLRATVATLLVVLIGGVAAVGAGAVLFKARTGQPLPVDESLLLRYNSFLGAAQMAVERPLLGFGPGNYKLESPPYWTQFDRSRFAHKPQVNSRVHNDFLEAAVEGGFPAALLYLGFLVCAVMYGLMMFFQSQESDRRQLGLVFAACFFAFMADGFFGFNYHLPVSAAILMTLAGAMEGARGVEPGANRASCRPKVAATFCAAVALVSLAMEIPLYAASHYYLKGLGAKEFKYYDESQTFLARSHRLAPWEYRYAQELGRLELDNRKQPHEALKWFQRAQTLYPSAPDIMAQTGLAELNVLMIEVANTFPAMNPQLLEERFERVEDWARRALTMVPNLSLGHELLARAALARHRTLGHDGSAQPLELAVHHARIALAYAQDKYTMLMLVAEAHMARDDIRAAEYALRQAGRLQPENMETWRQFQKLAEKSANWTAFIEAIEEASRILQSKPKAPPVETPDVLLLLADAQARGAKKNDAALRTLAAALMLAPERLDIWDAYADAAPSLPGKTKLEAVVDMLRAVRKRIEDRRTQAHPNVELVTQLVNPLFFRATVDTLRLRQAVESASVALGAEKTARDYGWLADLMLDTAMGLPESQRGPVLNELGMVYAVMNQWVEADTILAAAEPLLPPTLRAPGRLARSEALSQLGRHEHAIALAQGAVDAAPGAIEPQCQLARVTARSGKIDEARALYETALAAPGLDDALREQIESDMRGMLAQSAHQTAPRTNEAAGGGDSTP